MSSTDEPDPTSIRVDAGGRSLAAFVQGEGEPLVMLEVGLGAESDSWAAVAEGVAKFTRVCFYDRAGRGASDAAPKPRGPDDLVQDARRIVSHLSPSRPVVLVGQSLGGLIARLYAHRYPQEVAALVLVDSLHEDQFDVCGPHFPAPADGEPAMLASMRAFWTGRWRDPANNAEGIDLIACQAAGHEVTSLGRLPLRVLTATGFTQSTAPFGAAGPPLQAVWHQLHSRLARLSTDSSHQVIEDSGHFVQVDRPDAVVQVIRDVVEKLSLVRGA
jgi:pimeloyl-ACP methyl ester carboxylesterase